MKDLLKYKFCLVDEFENDDDETEATTVYGSKFFDIHHKLFRKSL